ncbi:hypothetical protein [Methanospirillum sp.]
MRKLSPEAEREAWEVVKYLVYDGRSLVSRPWVDYIICNHPFCFPNLATMPEKDRLETITYYLNRWFPLNNQTGQKPKAKTWVLCNGGGIPCLA